MLRAIANKVVINKDNSISYLENVPKYYRLR